MPSHIVKPDPERDFYVYWSTIVDAPTAWGTRADLETDPYVFPNGPKPDRFERADRTGTSARWPSASDPFLGWDDAELIYEGCATLHRSRLTALCDRLDNEQPVDDLIEPIVWTDPA